MTVPSKSQTVVSPLQPTFPLSGEGPAEQIKNSLQLLSVAETDSAGGHRLTAGEFQAVVARLRKAVSQLEEGPIA